MHTDTPSRAAFSVLAATYDVPTDHVLSPAAPSALPPASRLRRPLLLLLLFGGALLLALLLGGARLALFSDVYEGY
jgi:hypothetical protein